MPRTLPIGALVLVALAPSLARGATVAVLPIQGEVSDELRAQVESDVRAALADRADVVATRDEVQRAITTLGSVPTDATGMVALARALGVDYVLRVTVTPLPGQYRVEMSAFEVESQRSELIEQMVIEARASAEIRTILDQLLAPLAGGSAGTGDQGQNGEGETTGDGGDAAAQGGQEGEGEGGAPDEGGSSGEGEQEGGEGQGPQPEPVRDTRPYAAYGERPLELSVTGGASVIIGGRGLGGAGGVVGVGFGYSFYRRFGIGLRADVIVNFSNADAVGVTLGTGAHFALARGIPLFAGIRLGLGIMQSASGGRDTYFLLRPEPVLAYRFIRWLQLELRPATFWIAIGERTVALYEAQLGLAFLF